MGIRHFTNLVLAGLMVLLCGTLTIYAQTQPTTQNAVITAPPHKAVVIVFEGEVDDYRRDTLIRRYKDARTLGADTVILQIETYGGLVTAGLEISQFIKQQTDLHTIAYVHNKAISAGAMISMACDEIVMEPYSTIGDCAPIIFRTDGTLEAMPAAERAKQESPILKDFESSATRNGHDMLVAEAMVAVERVVHYVESPDGERRFVDQPDFDKLTAKGWKPVKGVPDPIDGPTELLTVQTEVANKIGLCKEIVHSPESFAQERNYQIMATLAPQAGEQIIEVLNSSFARGLLIALFILSVKIAMSAPGHGAAEASAIVTLGLVLGVPLLTGYAQWWEIVVIFAGLALLAFEIFVFPGHFVSGIIGAVMVVGGFIMTFVPKEPGGMPGFLPHLNTTYASLERGLVVVTSGLFCSLLLYLWLQRFLPKVPYFRRLVLNTSVGETTTPPPPATAWPIVGDIGQAITDLRPGGKAAFYDPSLGDNRITQVVSENGFVNQGAKLTVREVAGNRIVVRSE